MAGIFTHNGNMLQALPSNASQINYDNSNTGLSATQVQNAIDELNAKVDNKVNVSDMYNLLYPIGSVYLFHQDHAHKLVRECHF